MLKRTLNYLERRDGSSMVSAMILLSLLALFAFVVADVAVHERRNAHNEFVRAGAFFSADSGGEVAINFLRQSNRPPVIQDFGTFRVKSTATTAIHESQRYRYNMNFVRTRPRAGWSTRYRDFVYDVDSQGETAQNGRSNVGLVVSKIMRHGY